MGEKIGINPIRIDVSILSMEKKHERIQQSDTDNFIQTETRKIPTVFK